jgi:pilus assembly protein CpaB
MNRGGTVITVAAVLAILAAGAVFLFLSGVQHNAQSGGGTVKVIAAKQDIAAGTNLDTVISSGGLTFNSVPKDAAVRGAVTDLAQIKGQVTSQPLVAGQQLTTAFLVGSATQPQGGQYQIPEGYEAITLSLEGPQAGGGLVEKGDHVTIYVSFKDLSVNVINSGSFKSILAGQGSVQQTNVRIGDFLATVVPDVQVLKVLQAPLSASTQQSQVQLTLALRPDDAQKVIFSQEEGTVWFALLPPNQQGVPSKPVTYFDIITPDQLRAV